MKVRDITDAITADDRPTMRLAFSLLVETPTACPVETPSGGFLVVALNRLCAALSGDLEAMPGPTSAALGLVAGATFAAGAAQGKRDWSRLALALVQPP